MEHNLTDLTPYESTGWTFVGLAGYYVHRNRVYLQGDITSIAGSSGQTILHGLPSSICPAGPVSMTIAANIEGMELTSDLRTRSLPLSYSVTIDPSGTLSLDSPVPPYAEAPPPDWHLNGIGSVVLNYPALLIDLPLGQISWPLPAAIADTYETTSFAPYLGADFNDVDSTISVHGTRVHLGGHVQANRDGAGDGQEGYMFSGLPAQYDMVDLAGDPDTVDQGWTASRGPQGDYPIVVGVNPAGGPTPGGYGRLSTDSGPNLSEGTGFGAWLIGGSGAGRTPGPFFGLTGFGPAERAIATFPNQLSFDSGAPGYVDSASLDVNAFLAAYAPVPPDWIAVFAQIDSTPPSEAGFTPTANPSVVTDGGGTLLDQSTGAPAAVTAITADTFELTGFFAKGAPAYLGDIRNTATVTLWRPGEINTVTFTSGIFVPPAPVTNWSWSATIEVIMFFKNRDYYLRAGDVLDLTGAGWQVHYVAPPPTIVTPGPGTGGPLRAQPNTGTYSGTGVTTKLTIADLVHLARSVGLSGGPDATAAAIAMAESSGDPLNVGYNPGPPESWDRGLWQINSYYHPEITDQCAFNPPCNAQAMVTISNGGTNWTPWATYNNGDYLTYLTAALAVP